MTFAISLANKTRKVTIGVAKTNGTKRFYRNRYTDAVDFGANLVPSVFGLYFWLEWPKWSDAP